MPVMTGTLILKLNSEVFETEPGSFEIDFGGETFESKPAPATGQVNTFAKYNTGRISTTLHHTKACDVELLRRFHEGDVVAKCRDTGKEWQSTMSIAETLKLQDDGRGMPLVLTGTAFIQTKGAS